MVVSVSVVLHKQCAGFARARILCGRETSVKCYPPLPPNTSWREQGARLICSQFQVDGFYIIDRIYEPNIDSTMDGQIVGLGKWKTAQLCRWNNFIEYELRVFDLV